MLFLTVSLAVLIVLITTVGTVAGHEANRPRRVPALIPVRSRRRLAEPDGSQS